MFIQNKRGFTLIELIIVMGIFLVVIMITATAFKTVITGSAQQAKSVETQIEGLVGLEILRADLQQAGFGLPWTFSNAIEYAEPNFTNISTASQISDAPGNAPRAVISGDTNFNSNSGVASKFIVIKSVVAVANNSSKKWTTISYDSSNRKNIRLWDDTERDFAASDRVIVVKDSLITTPSTRQLMVPSSTVFSARYDAYSTQNLASPHLNGDTFEIYGISPDTNPATSLLMPFNRADYYIKRPSSNMPTSCAANTGILYKATVSHSTGNPTIGMPLLDCVADMQVLYGYDTSGDGFVNLHSTTPLTTAADIRAQLREIRVYILAQEGNKDLSFNYPSTTIDVGESFDGGATITGRRFNLQTIIGDDYENYRWKVYTIVVRPRNLVQ